MRKMEDARDVGKKRVCRFSSPSHHSPAPLIFLLYDNLGRVRCRGRVEQFNVLILYEDLRVLSVSIPVELKSRLKERADALENNID